MTARSGEVGQVDTPGIETVPEVVGEADNGGKNMPLGLDGVLSAISSGVFLGALIGVLVGGLVGVLVGRRTAPRPSRLRLRS